MHTDDMIIPALDAIIATLDEFDALTPEAIAEVVDLAQVDPNYGEGAANFARFPQHIRLAATLAQIGAGHPLLPPQVVQIRDALIAQVFESEQRTLEGSDLEMR